MLLCVHNRATIQFAFKIHLVLHRKVGQDTESVDQAFHAILSTEDKEMKEINLQEQWLPLIISVRALLAISMR